MFFAPIFFVASHSGYIIIAYVSDTQHAGPAAFWYIISFFYLFVSFRQLYDLCGKLVTKLCKVSSISKLRASLAAKCTCCQSTSETTTFNLSAFFIEVLLAIPLVGAEVFVVYVLVALPATLTAVSTDIYHLAQWAFVITTGLIAYKFIYTENKYKRYNIHHPEVHNSIRNTAFGYLTSWSPLSNVTMIHHARPYYTHLMHRPLMLLCQHCSMFSYFLYNFTTNAKYYMSEALQY